MWLLPLFLQDALPSDVDQWGGFAMFAGAIGTLFAALSLSQNKRIEKAEQREEAATKRADEREATANRRMDAALEGMGRQTTVITELTATVKQLAEESKASRSAVEGLTRELEFARRLGRPEG